MAVPRDLDPVRDRAAPEAERSPEIDRGRGSTHRLTLAYLGGGFAGWQRQDNALSVQEVVESALERVVGQPVRAHGASRTDAGVHAAGQEAHVTLERSWPPSALVAATNRQLPPEVRVLRAITVAPGFHARAWAVAKEYHYRMSRRAVLLPFEAPTTLRIPSRLDLDRVQSAIALLPGRRDWSAFARAGGSHHQSFRRVFAADLTESGDDLRFRIVGDGFLRGMVRALVGSLLWIGGGQLSLERWSALLDGGERADAGPSAPALGLTLMRVFYPEEPAEW